MKRNRAVTIAAILIIVIAAVWWLRRRDGGTAAINLVDRFDAATKRPDPSSFTVGDIALNGETKRAISVAPSIGTRLIHKVFVPDDGWLSVAVGLKPEAWTQEGNGVLFIVGVSDGRSFEPLFSQHVNPFSNQGDRKWIPVMVDLSAYAGEEIELIFNTYSSPAGKPDDQRGDLAVWGQPEIVVR
jgi:hypothetical protein